MANKEDYLDALTEYSKTPSRDIPPILEQYLNGVAKNGETLFQWQLLKPLIVGKMEQVIEELRQRLSSENIPDRPNVENVHFDVMRSRIMDALHKFNGAPFTIQRLCELLVDPKRHYKRSDKFMRGLEKNVLVVSTVDPYGRKVVSESGSKHLVNGIDSNGSPFFPRDPNVTSSLPPVPAWVTTTVSMTTRQQNKPNVESDQTPSKERSSQDIPSVASGGVTGSGVSSVYADQGEQPPAVHAEEVVEETVVAMDTSEADTVATDGGEAMADKDGEEEEIGDDTNASSSSSSSDELSASDTSESPGAPIVTSSSETESSLWPSVASEDKSREETASSSSDQYSSNVTDSAHSPEKISTSEVSPETPEKHVDSPFSTETKSSHSEHSETDSPVHSAAESSSEQFSDISTHQQSLNISSGFDISVPTGTTESASNENQELESNYTNNSVTSDVESDGSATGSDVLISPVVASVDSASDVYPSTLEQSPTNSSSTEVIASSSTDFLLERVTPLDSTEVCDSVAGLERLVDSVDPSHSQVPFSSLPAIINNNTAQPESSSDFECEEPQAKYRRISDNTSSPPLPITVSTSSIVSASSEIKASSSNYTLAGSEDMADTTTSDTTSRFLHASWANSSESLDVLTDNPVESETPTDVGGESTHENIISPPSKFLSSGASQGFDTLEVVANKCNTEEKLTEESQPEVTETKALTPETELVQEPMDQE